MDNFTWAPRTLRLPEALHSVDRPLDDIERGRQTLAQVTGHGLLGIYSAIFLEGAYVFPTATDDMDPVLLDVDSPTYSYVFEHLKDSWIQSQVICISDRKDWDMVVLQGNPWEREPDPSPMILALLYQSRGLQVTEAGHRHAVSDARVACNPVALVNCWRVLRDSDDYGIDKIAVEDMLPCSFQAQVAVRLC